MQILNVLGVTLRSYSLREALAQTDTFLKSGAMNTIVNLSAEMLMEAGKDERCKELLERADMTVLDDQETRMALGLPLKATGREAATGIYFQEFIRKNVREHNTFYLLTETAEQMQCLRQEIEEVSPKALFVGKHVCAPEEKTESIMNELNEAAPKVVLSVLPFDLQSQFLGEGRKYLNAEVWFAFRPEEILKRNRSVLSHRIRNKYSRRMLVKQLSQYQKESTGA